MKFKLTSSYEPSGDQPEAIRKLVDGLNNGDKAQTLLGVTGSGKTFTIANVLNRVNRPALILSHNKTLAAQLYSEFKQFSLKTLLNITSLTTIITSRKPIFRPPTLTLKKTFPSTTRSRSFGCIPPPH